MYTCVYLLVSISFGGMCHAVLSPIGDRPRGRSGGLPCLVPLRPPGVLCGIDPYTGQDYNHRRDWIRDFQQRLAGLFGIEIGFRAELANHIHLVLRTRPDVVETWTDEEVARRMMTVYRLVKSKDGQTIREVTDDEVASEISDPERVVVLRKRLSSISDFMQALCEHIAVRANREDGSSGHFWEERFGARNLASESAVLVCGMYVDLNQIRAGEALTPEDVDAHLGLRSDRSPESTGQWRDDRRHAGRRLAVSS